MGALRLAASALLAVALAPPAAARPRPPSGGFSALSVTDQAAIAQALRARVAQLQTLEPRPKDSPMTPILLRCYGVPIGPTEVVTVPQLAPADQATIIGPKGQLPARAVLRDEVRRVVIFQTQVPLSTIGLQVPPPLPAAERALDMDVFALTHTEGLVSAVGGVLVNLPEMPEYEGHPRISLKLRAAMPAFDRRLRWIGYSRVVAWDVDRFMLIPPEKVTAARAAAAKPPPKPTKANDPPWWAKKPPPRRAAPPPPRPAGAPPRRRPPPPRQTP